MWNKCLNYFKRLSATKKATLILVVLLVSGYALCLPEELFHVPYSTVVTDRKGELLGARIATDGQWRFPPRKDVPDKIKQCLITFEDKRFYSHWGVDPLAIGRAFCQNIKNRCVVSGGSTLTMQTIRLARHESRTIGEKLIEIIWATRLELRASKEEILAMYASHAPFGGNVVGLDAAAWRYFGHTAEDLSWAEAATLAVLPNAPSMIHLSKGRDKLLNKRNRLLKQLQEREIIDSSTYELAISEPLPGEPHPLPQVAPHLVSYFYKKRNGAYVQSTLDKGLQTQVEAVAERWSDEFSRSGIRNIAILAIDIQANEVAAYCGNVHFERQEAGYQVDIIQAPRSTGSILKPFLYYAMLKEGSLLPHTLLPDIPLNINGFTPQNFNMQYEGAVPASEALARSLNIPAVTMLRKYGVPKFHKELRQMGFRHMNKPSSHYGLSLILGGAEATLWEVTNAYKNLASSSPSQSEARLVKETAKRKRAEDGRKADAEHIGAAWQTLTALTEVNRPGEIDWKSLPSMQTVAWKTGTSYGFRDAWAVGVTPRHAIGVWVGNATGEGKPGLVGAQTAAPVLFDVLNLFPSSAWFERPNGVFIEAEICKQSGYLKGRFCEDTDTLLILPAGLRTEPCPFHRLVTLSADEKYRVYENQLHTESTVKKAWFTLPPAWEWYYRQRHPEYQPLPPFKSGYGEEAASQMQFIYPSANARVTLTKQMDGSEGYLTAELAHSNPHETVFWHLDEDYLGQTQDFHKLSIQPNKGKHTLTAVDGQGNTVSVSFFVD